MLCSTFVRVFYLDITRPSVMYVLQQTIITLSLLKWRKSSAETVPSLSFKIYDDPIVDPNSLWEWFTVSNTLIQLRQSAFLRRNRHAELSVYVIIYREREILESMTFNIRQPIV